MFVLCWQFILCRDGYSRDRDTFEIELDFNRITHLESESSEVFAVHADHGMRVADFVVVIERIDLPQTAFRQRSHRLMIVERYHRPAPPWLRLPSTSTPDRLKHTRTPCSRSLVGDRNSLARCRSALARRCRRKLRSVPCFSWFPRPPSGACCS